MSKDIREILKRFYDIGYRDGEQHLVRADLKIFPLVIDEALTAIRDVVMGQIPETKDFDVDYDYTRAWKSGYNYAIEQTVKALAKLFEKAG